MTLKLARRALRPIRRATRDVWWRYKGRTIVNPPVPAGACRLLFVCLGNICRSPFAEAIALDQARTIPVPGLEVSSAGIHTKQAAAPPPEARQAATAFGVSLETHRTTMLTRALAEAHDMILVMERAQQELLCRQFPDLESRIFLLPLFESGLSGERRYNIVDPFGLPQEAFDACYERIDRAVRSLLAALRVAAAEPASTGRTTRTTAVTAGQPAPVITGASIRR